MKGYLSIVFLFFLMMCRAGHGQTVSIPDPALLGCLASRFPQTLDSSKRLILSEAAKVTEPLLCRAKGMKNAEGVQYFTSLGTLDISFNKLTFIPDLFALKKLQVLDISDNEISEVGQFSSLVNLNNLDLKNNKLTSLPDFSKNTKLEILSAPGNLLDTIPDLAALTKLKQLYLHENRLTRLPVLSGLVLLSIFNCSNNQLKILPSMSPLKELTIFSVSENLLGMFPELPPVNKIQTLNLQYNALTALPDFSRYDSLKTATLFGNQLTFEDLLPVSILKNYSSIFQVSPQHKLPIAKSIEVMESQMLTLETGVDSTQKNMSFEWFFNGKSIRKSSKDALVFSSAQMGNEGYYFARLSNPVFPALVLETDSFKVTVFPCINLNGFSTLITGMDCEKAGSLKVTASGQPSATLNYSLKSVATGKVFTSTNGTFEQLNEPSYNLTVAAGNGCTTKFTSFIDVPGIKCDFPFITPNGDGVDDTYFFKGKGKASITDKWGNKIQVMTLPYEWNGTSSSELVSPGLYLVNINDGEEVIKITVVY